jgi:two-component system, NarL family, invasion response regulator UvrY
MINILIADDHPIVRRGLKEILSDEHDVGMLGEASTSQEVLDLVRKGHWDIVVLDITMPGRGGLDVLKELKQECPRLPVLVLSVHPEDQYGMRAFRAGAAGYMTKESAPEHLIAAIRKIKRGEKYVTPTLAEKLASDLERDVGKPLHETLSNREYQVMCMIASGKTVGQIGEELFLSAKTISIHRSRILSKMKMRNNAELTHYAVTNRLIG